MNAESQFETSPSSSHMDQCSSISADEQSINPVSTCDVDVRIVVITSTVSSTNLSTERSNCCCAHHVRLSGTNRYARRFLQILVFIDRNNELDNNERDVFVCTSAKRSRELLFQYRNESGESTARSNNPDEQLLDRRATVSHLQARLILTVDERGGVMVRDVLLLGLLAVDRVERALSAELAGDERACASLLGEDGRGAARTARRAAR